MTVLADFIFLGHQQNGSWALSSDKTELFAMACGAYLDIIAETFNSQGIPNLIDINGDHFAGITDYPKLTHVMDAMVGEKKISPGGTVELDASNPPKGDSAWFNISPDDIDSMEIFYLTYRYRFAPEEEEE